MDTLAMKVTDTRRANLELLLKAAGGPKNLADRLNLEEPLQPNYISQLRNGKKSFGNAIADKISVGIGEKEGWMDTLHDGASIPELPERKPSPEKSKPEDAAEDLLAMKLFLGAIVTVLGATRPSEGERVLETFQAKAGVSAERGLGKALAAALGAAVKAGQKKRHPTRR